MKRQTKKTPKKVREAWHEKAKEKASTQLRQYWADRKNGVRS